MTVLEVIKKSSDFLARKGVESPRLQTELLLANILNMPRMKLYLNFERTLSTTEIAAVRELVKRRGQREPLQHIVGSTSFCGFEMAVNPHVLVPRRETELLAEAGWQFLSTLAPQPSTTLDFGTGSGCIAIALAGKCPAAQIVALDASVEALTLAKQNATANGVAERIEFVQGGGFDALQNAGQASRRPQTSASMERGSKPVLRFALIISNPPYIPTAEIASLQPEVRDFDPRAALDGGADGLDFYRMFASNAEAHLRPRGKLMLELGDGQAEAVKQLLESQKWIVESVKQDYSQVQRILIARR